MRKLGLGIALAASVAVSGCSTYGSGYGYDPYYNNGYYGQQPQGYDSQGRRIATGAAVGAVGGEALHKKSGSKIEEAAGETIPIGGAGLIVAYKRDDAAVVEPAVTRAIQKVVGEADGRHVAALKAALADAQAKMAAEGG